jgi:hypothetical protein
VIYLGTAVLRMGFFFSLLARRHIIFLRVRRGGEGRRGEKKKKKN